VLYSHDTFGLGHSRRNWKISTGIAEQMDVDILLISGNQYLNQLPLSKGVDLITLPSLDKKSDGSYCSRSLSMEIDDLIELRSNLIGNALSSFGPDLFIVDTAPKGALGELIRPLNRLKIEHDSKIVLGLRDVLDESSVLNQEWVEQNNFSFVDENFDFIWVYGDKRVFPTLDMYSFSDLAKSRTFYTGYVSGVSFDDSSFQMEGGFDLCLVGGGQDGVLLAECFAKAALKTELPSVIVPGPFMNENNIDALVKLADESDNIKIVTNVVDMTPLYKGAKKVVSMAGYNTSYELLSEQIPVLFVPRTSPRQEQLVRAQRLKNLGCADMIHPADLSVELLIDWLEEKRERILIQNCNIDLGGIEKIPSLIKEVLNHKRLEMVAL